jgi:triosephosphate isomerase
MKSILVANWKMNPATFREAKALFDATKKASDKAKNVQVIVAPPAIYLRQLSTGYRGKISFAIQNGFQESHGAHTGETSFAQAADAHAAYALVGHAERRAMGETNEETRTKVAGALKQELTPILCVGERSRDGSGQHFPFVREQLRIGLADVPVTSLKKVIIAYEPVWAIGAPKPMTPRDMHEMSIFIRKTIVEFYGEGGMDVKIIYGGSIDEISAPEMLRDGDVRGLLVGRASAESHHITKLLAAAQSA